MISGHATPEGTTAFSRQHAPVAFSNLGETGLIISQAGFGGYRVAAGIKQHETALRHALDGGINLIDTSSNYTDGASETLIGQVLEDMIASGRISRQQVIVVSKVGYLQGQNLELSQQRKREGRPFQELVEPMQGLEHCIHPEFIADQLTRSLERLKLRTLDGYLLHNPEYYLGLAHKQGVKPETARKEYYRRIHQAFHHLENEVKNGRIRFYGISSNTFPSKTDDPEFTCLAEVWKIAESISPDHHFRLIQLPFNLLETGAALARNQPGGQTVLEFARKTKLGVLINRPLNAFTGNQMLRLADINEPRRMDDKTVIQSIRAVGLSETRLWLRILPQLDIPSGIQVRIKEQLAIGDTLKHYWKNFVSYERWRMVKNTNFHPRIQGVMDFLKPHAGDSPDLSSWIADHSACLENAYQAVGSIYADQAAREIKRLRAAVSKAAPEWSDAESISRMAIRAVRSTSGVSTVLVGMRREAYVNEVLDELRFSVERAERREIWERLRDHFA